jgi:hypothetical protein
MKIADFDGIHEGENVLCLGTGVSILNTPVDFLRSMPSVGINYLPYYNDLLDGFMPTYWVALDTGPTVLLNTMPKEVVRFIPTRQRSRVLAAGRSLDSTILFEMDDMPRPIRSGYSTTMAAAVQIALYMGAKNVLVDGFDCTRGNRSDSKADPGKTGTQHFYDPKCGKAYAPGWDKNVAEYASWAEERGRRVLNISNPTMARLSEKSSYEQWLEE